MKNKKVLFGIIIFLFAITGVCSIQNVVALDDPDYSVTIIGGHAFKLFWTLNEDDCIKMEYLITGGNADLHLYIRNSTGDVIKDFGTIDDYGIRYFNIPYDDTFEIIFKNDALFTSRDLELNIDIVKNLTITSPTSMSTFVNGYNYITWTSSGAISYIIIDLYKDGYFLERISSTVYNDGSYTWYIYTNEYTDSSYYQIKILDYYDNTIYDYSGSFTIECETESDPIPTPIPDPDPVNTVNRIINIILMIAVISAIVSAIVIPVVIVHKRKKRISEEVIKPIE